MRAFNRGLLGGLLASFSIGVGYLPVGFSFGVAAIHSGIPPAIALLVSVLVYAGASQFLLISLLASGSGILAALPPVLVMNARHVLYGPSLAVALPSHERSLASPLLTFGLTDEVYATASSRMEAVPLNVREYWLLGLQLGAYASWLAGTSLGVMLVGDVERWPAALREGMTFVLPALFLALLLDAGIRRWSVSVGVAGAVTALSSLALASHHALIAGMLAGSLTHFIVARRRDS